MITSSGRADVRIATSGWTRCAAPTRDHRGRSTPLDRRGFSPSPPSKPAQERLSEPNAFDTDDQRLKALVRGRRAERTGGVAPLRTRRAPTACSWCRYRKVRCDASILGCPCTRCRQDGRSNCVLRPHFRQCVYHGVALWSRILTVATKEGSPRHFPVRVDYPVHAMKDKPIQTRSLAPMHRIIETMVW